MRGNNDMVYELYQLACEDELIERILRELEEMED